MEWIADEANIIKSSIHQFNTNNSEVVIGKQTSLSFGVPLAVFLGITYKAIDDTIQNIY